EGIHVVAIAQGRGKGSNAGNGYGSGIPRSIPRIGRVCRRHLHNASQQIAKIDRYFIRAEFEHPAIEMVQSVAGQHHSFWRKRVGDPYARTELVPIDAAPFCSRATWTTAEPANSSEQWLTSCRIDCRWIMNVGLEEYDVIAALGKRPHDVPADSNVECESWCKFDVVLNVRSEVEVPELLLDRKPPVHGIDLTQQEASETVATVRIGRQAGR